MDRYVLAIDQGTTGTTGLLVDRRWRSRVRSPSTFPQHYPRPGWVEHDPEEIWFSVLPGDPAGPGADRNRGDGRSPPSASPTSGRRRSCGSAPRAAGSATPSSGRTGARPPLCRELRERGLEPLFRDRTGLFLDPYFAGTKLTWLLRQDEACRRGPKPASLAFGTVDSFLVWRLTGGAAHVTDVSNASRTLLMDLRTLDWDDELLGLLEVPGGAPARDPPLRRRSTATPAGWNSCPTASRWPGWPATSRRPSSARPASRRGRPSAPTAPAPSSWRTPAGKSSPAPTAC